MTGVADLLLRIAYKFLRALFSLCVYAFLVEHVLGGEYSQVLRGQEHDLLTGLVSGWLSAGVLVDVTGVVAGAGFWVFWQVTGTQVTG